MCRAVARLPAPPDLALVDGDRPPALPCAVRCVVGGDGLSLSIAAASIVAKVLRDRAMVRLAARFPGYGWEENVGYSTPFHRAARRLGPTRHHRPTFGAVRQLALDLELAGAEASLGWPARAGFRAVRIDAELGEPSPCAPALETPEPHRGDHPRTAAGSGSAG